MSHDSIRLHPVEAPVSGADLLPAERQLVAALAPEPAGALGRLLVAAYGG